MAITVTTGIYLGAGGPLSPDLYFPVGAVPAGAGPGYRADDSPFGGAFEQGRSDGCSDGEGPLWRGQEGLAAGMS